MKRNILILISIITALTFSYGFANAAPTASSVLSKASSKINGAKGIYCSYTISAGKNRISGILKSVDSKFYIVAGGNTSWYNGKDLYTHTSASGETTIVKPTKSELAETNPLSYLKGYSSIYNATFSKNTPKGKYVVDLLPKSRKAPVRKITVTLNAKTYVPEKMVITDLNKSVTTVTISKISYNTSIPSSTFEYPRSKYPKAMIVDLR